MGGLCSSEANEMDVNLSGEKKQGKKRGAKGRKGRSQSHETPGSIEDMYHDFVGEIKYADRLQELSIYPVFSIEDVFRKGAVLGKGGYGEVVVVEPKKGSPYLERFEGVEAGKRYAMKSMNLVRKEKDTFPAFENEVTIHRKLHTAHIVKMVAAFVSTESNGQYHIVTELCLGGEVFDRIVNMKRFSESIASEVIRQMLVALEHCHKNNVVHRDLKPSNFVFANNDLPLIEKIPPVKLIDFGLAKSVKPSEIYTDKVGTPFYVSPETIDSKHPYYNLKSGEILKCGDMWSMGAIVFVMITGKLPFPGRKHRDIFKNITRCKFKFPESLLISDSAKDFISSLLLLDPTERLTCNTALEHPWIASREKFASDTPLGDFVQNGILAFQTHTKLQKAVARVAVNHLTEKDIAMLQDLFAKYDTDHSGTIEIPELIQMLRDTGFDAEAAEQEASQIMEELDTNNDGVLSVKEFAQLASRPRLSINRTIVRRTFESMDIDGDGFVSPDEMKSALGSFIDEEYVAMIFKQKDGDGDGMLTFEEFLEAIKKTVRDPAKKHKPRASVFDLNFRPPPIETDINE